MELGQVSSPQQQSASPPPQAPGDQPPPNSEQPNPSEALTPDQQTPPVDPPVETPAGDEPPVTDDWRARMAGDDTSLLETLSRYKTEGDLAKAFAEQRRKLSERPSVLAALPEDATPEQIAEFREARGVPEEGTLEAYDIKPPEGYDLTDGEKGVLGAVVKDLHSKNMGQAEVATVIDHYFQAQEAGFQQMRETAIDLREGWQQELKGELGRDYETIQAAGEAYLNERFGEDVDGKNALLTAQLPGGGYLGDHPEFFRMISDLALQNGHGDRIEANAYESNGKSLEVQQGELEALRTNNPALYNSPQTQEKLDKIYSLRVSRGEIDEMGNPIRRR